MGSAQLPLVFFIPTPNTNVLSAGESIAAGSVAERVIHSDPARLLDALKARRGFARLKVTLPTFSLDHAPAKASLEGKALKSHIEVGFYGNFDKLAKPLFRALVSEGFACYSVWDMKIIERWPGWEELEIDAGYADRMSRLCQRETLKINESEADPARRTRILGAFLKSPRFRAEMAKEGRLEQPKLKRQRKTYCDLVNCFARWKSGHPTAQELAAVRKLHPECAAISISELRRIIGDSPRFLLLTGAHPDRANLLRDSAGQKGLLVDIEAP